MILRGSVFSNVLEMNTGITVMTPTRIKKEGSYKVIYLLHGLCSNSGDWLDNTMLSVYAKAYDVIFIMPEVARSFYADMKYGLKYFKYVTDELPKICKSIFNISAKREDTVVIGGSMGGYGALKCALSRPEQYGICCAFSSACLFLKESLDNNKKDVEAAKKLYGEQLIVDFTAIFGDDLEWKPDAEILELAKRANTMPIKPVIYAACGTEDYLHEDNERFCEEMKKLDFDFTYEEWSGIHDWYFFDEALKKALKRIFQ